jgi:hypothetical protein
VTATLPIHRLTEVATCRGGLIRVQAKGEINVFPSCCALCITRSVMPTVFTLRVKKAAVWFENGLAGLTQSIRPVYIEEVRDRKTMDVDVVWLQ